MYGYHVREILEFYEWDEEYVISTILKNNLSVSDDHVVVEWHEEVRSCRVENKASLSQTAKLFDSSLSTIKRYVVDPTQRASNIARD